jgi:disulfide bond formation protein DsbB
MLIALLKIPRSGWIIFAASVVALAFAFTMQYGFDVQPCILCLWQRVPYTVVALLALIACLWRPYGRITKIILMLCTALFAVETGVAFFHTGVELHWWLGTKGCAIQPLNGTSVEDLRMQLLHTVVARCDEISWTFLGLSMANWNVLYAAVLTVFAGMASRQVK